MQLYDLKFDSNQGEVEIDEAGGIATFKFSEKNPRYPGGAQFQVPLDPIIEALKANAAKGGGVQAKLEEWGLDIVEGIVDRS